MEWNSDVYCDRGFLYAEACFETFRVVDGKIFHWQEHLSRLREGLACFGIDLHENPLPLCLEAAAGLGNDALLRITVSGGEAPWGIRRSDRGNHRIHIMTRSYEDSATPVALRSVKWPFPLQTRPAKFTADYAETLRGFQIVRRHLENGEEPLICDNLHIITAMTANVLIYRDGDWWTPAGKGVLPGVIRGALLRSGTITAVGCPVGWLTDCKAMAISNSGMFVRPVHRINGRKMPVSGPVFDRLWKVLAGQPGVPL